MQLQKLPDVEEGANLFRSTSEPEMSEKINLLIKGIRTEGRDKGVGSDARLHSITTKMLWAVVIGNAAA